MRSLRIALAQINATVGDLSSNVRKIAAHIQQARKSGANLVVFPELAISGYPPEDLLLKPAFLEACRRHLEDLIKASEGIIAIVGFPEKMGKQLFNAAAILHNGKLIATYHKHDLPNYGVFDEQRYFTPGKEDLVFVLGQSRFAANICEDIWIQNGIYREQASLGHAELLINISASPYHQGKQKLREEMLSKRAQSQNVTVAYCNLVGGQDELVFDGGSCVFAPSGKILARGKQFQEDLVLIDVPAHGSGSGAKGPAFKAASRNNINHLMYAAQGLVSEITLKCLRYFATSPKEIVLANDLQQKAKPPLAPHLSDPLSELDEIYEALVLGTRDYILKNGFSNVVIGLSGGIDSALTACIAADAIGPTNVTGVSLPSQYSSEHSKADAAELAKRLGIHFTTISIEPIYNALSKALEPVFRDTQIGVTEENLQSRIRGTLLMALSNKFGWLVLTTGNKSEVSVGYATLYGDMAGGFAVIKDVPKVLVYELAKNRNLKKSVVPENVFQKPPSAELRPNQKDSDSLPEYSVLDPILKAYVEQNASVQEIAAKGFAPEVVKKVVHLVDRAEYKRRQGPPGIKITERALGKDWRLPLTNHFVS